MRVHASEWHGPIIGEDGELYQDVDEWMSVLVAELEWPDIQDLRKEYEEGGKEESYTEAHGGEASTLGAAIKRSSRVRLDQYLNDLLVYVFDDLDLEDEDYSMEKAVAADLKAFLESHALPLIVPVEPPVTVYWNPIDVLRAVDEEDA